MAPDITSRAFADVVDVVVLLQEAKRILRISWLGSVNTRVNFARMVEIDKY